MEAEMGVILPQAKECQAVRKLGGARRLETAESKVLSNSLV